MSVIATATFDDQSFEVEVFRDGSLEFLDQDLQYDAAAVEFGYAQTPALKFKQEWDCNAPKAIIDYIPLSFEHLVLLGVDWAEHTIGVFPVDCLIEEGVLRKQAPFAESMELARKYARGGFEDNELRKTIFRLESYIATLIREQHQEPARIAARALWSILNATQAPDAFAAIENIRMVSEFSIKAASLKYKEVYREHGPNWVVTFDGFGHDYEMVWQVQRFVDCMEAIGQGKDWPDLGATP